MNRVSVHLSGQPPLLTPCRLADGWCAFEAAAFATLGLDARTHVLHQLWLCSREGVAESMVLRDALHVLRDLDHVRVLVARRDVGGGRSDDSLGARLLAQVRHAGRLARSQRAARGLAQAARVQHQRLQARVRRQRVKQRSPAHAANAAVAAQI
jgi:hypothetical protein